MPVLLSEAVQTLLSGNTLSWAKFGDFKAGSIELASPGARRLLHFLLSCDQRKVADAKEELFNGLIAAWQNTSFDPAAAAMATTTTSDAGRWRLVRLESAGFGGLNLVDGPNFVLVLGGENWCLEGQNGSGKTSIASAIIWALTGCRSRDQDGVIVDDGRRMPVFNDSGVQIGDWPPTVSYPATLRKLSGAAEAWVRLTFQNENGNIAEAYRRLVAPPSEEPQFEAKVDPVLQSAPQLIETGLLMPARLTRISFGERSQSIYEAVKANKAAYELKIIGKREDKDYAKELRDIADSASALAGTDLSILSSDVASGLDTSKPDDRAKIKNAVSTARGILQQNVKGITAFDAWAALKSASTDVGFQELPAALADAKTKLAEAIVWDKRQAEDDKLRLKALASQFFVAPGHAHEDADCPLCESKLSGDKRKALAAELEELKKSADAAERKLSDACAELEKIIRDATTPQRALSVAQQNAASRFL